MTKLDWDKAKRQTPPPFRKSDAALKAELKKLKSKPTAKQLAYLRNLGVRRKPETRAEASELIDKALDSQPCAFNDSSPYCQNHEPSHSRAVAEHGQIGFLARSRFTKVSS